MSDSELKVEDVAKNTPGLFSSRLSGKKLEFAGTTFHLRALPALVVTYIKGEASSGRMNESLGIVTALYVRYGIEDIEGLTDEGGKPVEIIPVDITPVRFGGKQEKMMGVSQDVLNQIHPDIFPLLFQEIVTLTHLMPGGKGEPTRENPDGSDKPGEKEKLDFSTASETPRQDQENGAE